MELDQILDEIKNINIRENIINNQSIVNYEIFKDKLLNKKISVSKFRVNQNDNSKDISAINASRKELEEGSLDVKNLSDSKAKIKNEEIPESNLKLISINSRNFMKKSNMISDVNFTNLDFKNHSKILNPNLNFENDLLNFSFLETIQIIFCSFSIGNKDLKQKKLIYKKYSEEVYNKIDLLTLVQNVADKEVLLEERSLGLL